MEDFKKRIQVLKEKLDIEALKKRASEIGAEMAKPEFWQDQTLAREKTQELAELKKTIENLETLDLSPDEKMLADLELKTFLSGPYDKNDAILSIHAGQGGTEAMDWAEILQRMYLRYAEKRNWQTDVVDLNPGEEAGIKSVTMTISGTYAYGYLKGEAGVHRLVRQSPFNADRLRQTSFAQVVVLPQIEEAPEISISENDLSWEFFRASSQGGQNVQKVSSAVRLRHKPTGIVVCSQSQRYQEQNRKIALMLLRAKLWALASARAKEEEKKLKGEVKVTGWGNQIRSYVLHPYKMVKDLRTQVETSDPEKVLDGELDLFIEAELKSMV
ncbi:MAG: peptide chain release factor 2 [Patescibacteria group bacterium]